MQKEVGAGEETAFSLGVLLQRGVVFEGEVCGGEILASSRCLER